MSARGPVRIGLLGFFTDDCAPVTEVARLAEERGVESLWAPEHTHIPVDYTSETPTGRALPESYRRIFDPFVVLTAAAAATTRIRLGTGIALVANHDPITLAKQIATLDRISGGRFILGVGAGWIREEIENHGVEFETRWSRAVEHVEAMRAIWTQEKASFSGRWVNFEPLWSWPKPVQQPHPPVHFATLGPSPLVIRHADGWLPLSNKDPAELPGRIAELRARAEAAGRDPAGLEITVFSLGRTDAAQVEDYGAMGADRVILRPKIGTTGELEQFLEPYAGLLAEAGPQK
ncbi:MAG TPA: LLM class F420-dependent oxidoreductase [Acidimicrobiia bacterium]|nr:LLM class F420-dependent oxidoreductase [Acidimicrobiia bacterium]